LSGTPVRLATYTRWPAFRGQAETGGHFDRTSRAETSCSLRPVDPFTAARFLLSP
jgi:hypothetical protein